LLEYFLDRDSADLHANKERRAHWRGDRSNTQVEDDHDSKMDDIHTKSQTHRKEDRRKDQDSRCHIHECADDQQDHVDQKQDDVFIIRNSKECIRYKLWNACERHDPRHDRRNPDQEDDDTGHLRALLQDRRNISPFHRLIAIDRQQQRVYDRDDRTFRGCENAKDDSANDDDDQKQARDRMKEHAQLFFSTIAHV